MNVMDRFSAFIKERWRRFSVAIVADDPWDSEYGGEDGPLKTTAKTPSLNDFVVIAPSTASIIDNNLNQWTITVHGQVSFNGLPDPRTASVVELAWVSGKIWLKTATGHWYWKLSPDSQWMQASGSPLPKVVPPSPATGLRVTAMTATSITLSWFAPAIGTRPILYTVFIRKVGQSGWQTGATSSTTSAVVPGLTPATSYNIEVSAHNK